MRSKSLSGGVCSALIVALLGLAPVGSSGASEDLETVVWMATDEGHWGGGPPADTFFPPDADISLEGDASEVVVGLDGEYPPKLTFAAPRGELLSERTYDHTMEVDAREGDRAGFEVQGNGWWCGAGSGQFSVRRIVVEPDGSVSSLWIVFEQHCIEHLPSLIGEVRYRVPGDGGTAIVSAREVDWGRADRRQPMHLVPVRVLNPSHEPLVLGTPAVEGADAAAFKMNARDCDGVAVLPGETCTVWLRFLAAAAGAKTATLVVPEGAGTTHRTALKGFVYGGTTRFVLSSHPDDYVGDGRFYDFTPASGRFEVTATESRIDFELHGEDLDDNDSYWYAMIEAPDGEVLQLGRRYTNAPEPPGSPYDEPGWGFAVWGDHRVCDAVSEFTVRELEIDDFGDVTRLGVSFVQRCKSGRPAGHLKGLLDFRAEDAHAVPKRPPRFHDRLLLVMHHRTYIEGGFDRQWWPTRKVCWFRVPIHVYNADTDRLLGRLRSDRHGNFRWNVPGPHDGPRIPLAVVAPVLYLPDGWVCAKAEQYP